MSRPYALMALALLAALVLAAPATAAALRYRMVEGADGVPLNVVEAGDPARPAILFVHGIGQSHLSFENQLHSPLASEFHLVAFDLRGHGSSGKPWGRDAYVDSRKWADDVQRVITASALRAPLIVGWSYGTLVVADYLRHHGGEPLAGIALVGAYGGFTPPPGAPPPQLAAAMKKIHEQQVSPDLEENIAAVRAISHTLTARQMPAEWYERATLIGMLLPLPARGYMFERSFANQDLVGSIHVPLLLFVGSKDVSTPEDAARDFAAKVPGARVTVYPQSGHSPFAEDPQRFNNELAEFARSAFARASKPRS